MTVLHNRRDAPQAEAIENSTHRTRRARFRSWLGGLGIKIKLPVAFAAVSVMTLVAAAVAITSFSAAEQGVQNIASRDVPLMTDALRLSAISGEISAAAARFVSARTADEQGALAARIRERYEAFTAMLDHMREGRKNPAFAAVEAPAQRLDVNLRALAGAIEERSTLRSSLEAKLEALNRSHAQVGDKLAPVVKNSYSDVVAAAEDVGRTADKIVKSLVNDGLQVMQAIVDVGAETNLVTGLLTAGTLTSSPSILSLLEDRFTSSALRVQKLLAKLPPDPKFDDLRKRVAETVQLADFKPRIKPSSKSDSKPETNEADPNSNSDSNSESKAAADDAKPAAADDNDLARLQNVFRVHERLANVLVALVDDLNFDLLTQSDDAIKQSSKVIKGLVTNQIAGLRNALDIAAQTHLVASVLSESAVAKDVATLAPFQDRFKASSDSLAKLSETVRDEQIKKAISELLAFGQGDASVSALRGKELAATLRADATIEENTRIQRELDQAVSDLVTEIERRMHRNIGQLTDKLDQDRILLIIAAVLSLLASGAIAVLYVQRNLVRRLCAIRDAMRLLSAGDTALDVPAAEDRDEIGEMARAVRIFRDGAVARERLEGEAAEQRRSNADTQEKVAQEQRRGMEEQRRSAQEQAHVVRALKAGLGKLSGGDLTYRLSDEFPPAYREIKDEFNLTMSRLRETIQVLAESTREVSGASTEISTSTADLSQRAEEQAATLEQTSASLEEISAVARKTAENAQHASASAGKARACTNSNGQVVAKAVTAMARIKETSDEISDIIGVIDEIARQTNLLALNAAVEAARAGDAGRGFAVVASEVRSLAQRSAQAAKDIKQLLTSSAAQVRDGVDLVNTAGAALGEILSSIDSVADIVADIAAASGTQTDGLEQVNKALAQMDDVTQQNAALVQANAESARVLDQQAQAMNERVSLFQLEERTSRVAKPRAAALAKSA
jgi:methyl-accepting chemotaxis protein